jgi:hypothetical protein
MNKSVWKAGICLLVVSVSSFAQRRAPVQVCKQPALAAFKPLPKLKYECPEALNDYDNKILKLPERLAAIRRVERTLQSFTSATWWNASVDDLNACEIHGRAGSFTSEEKEKVKEGDYSFQLFGNHQIRLVLLSDPCYQTEFAGSNAFLLVHQNAKVFVTEVLDGYGSRVANSVGVDFANLNGQRIVEVSTANSFPPSLVYYYFSIDPKTNQAVPKNIFQEDHKLTNEIYSAMLMAETKDLGLPRDARELNIIRHGRLAPTFSAYEETEHGKIDDRLRRIIYRWNGRSYVGR